MVSLVINLTKLFPNGNNLISIWKQTGAGAGTYGKSGWRQLV